MVKPESAGVLLYHGDNFYFLERNPQYINNDKHRSELEYPGGKIQGEENYKLCAIRETLEETANTIELTLSQLDENKSSVAISPKPGEVCLFLVELNAEQLAIIPKAQNNIKEKFASDPKNAEVLDIHPVSKQALKLFMTNRNRDLMPKNLSLRSFNI